MRLRSSRLAPLCLALGGLVLGGCKDDRETAAGPSSAFFDGDTVFGALVNSGFPVGNGKSAGAYAWPVRRRN